MRISEQWLREWVSPKLESKALANRLTLAGLEVTRLEPAGADLKGVVVGRIDSLREHPHADRLKLCFVDIGRRGRLEIVCGAPNVVAGMKVAVALPGTELPNGVHVEKSEIRGVVSMGMLCSAFDLGLAESAEGLLPLGSDASLGQPVRDYLRLDDMIMEIELTPNRGDCLSVAGVAREVAALTATRLKAAHTKIRNIPATSKRRFKIKLQAGQDCPRYVGRVIEGINSTATSPIWMVERLRRSGARSISSIVDVTNYVMLELGQPMHVFDLDKLVGGIRVRHAKKNESLTLLDGTRPRIQAGTLLIADHNGPVALAGIMGGLDSAVTDKTHNLLIESAYFRPQTIAGRARSLGIQTESSFRFERGVDPYLQRQAMQRATSLLLDIVGGRPGPILEESLTRHVPKRASVTLRRRRLTQLLGQELPVSKTQGILTRLGMRVRKRGDGWRVTPPSHRFDIEREEDLVEEVARVYGFESLPSQMPRISMGSRFASENHIPAERFKAVLADRDYQEVITYSFVDPALQRLLEPATEPMTLRNPISADMAAMRISLWPGLLQAVVYNRNRQQSRLRLFELGRCFVGTGKDLVQELMLGGALMGPVLPEQWGSEARAVDFYDAKGDLEALLQVTGSRDEFQLLPGQHPALHSGQSAEITKNGANVGWLGALHPEFVAKLDLDDPVFLFQVRISVLQTAKVPQFSEVSKFPAIRRDLSFMVDAGVPAQAVLDCAAAAAGELLVDLQLFDEYRGEGIDSGRKSLSLGLTLQDSSRTLKEEIIEAITVRVIDSLYAGLGAELRKK
ncbi:MAG: phenylalanine--tRNA ligase subunit beta [Proteobacteria bacterium]|nr:MAG: phenylalanine--tRNA ligase subunit beta [Pseudomonadota bacterium]